MTPEQRAANINSCREMLKAGRIRVLDMERRDTYPANPDPDTVAIAEHYKIKWRGARILKALSFFTLVTRNEMADITGIHHAVLHNEVLHAAERARVRVDVLRCRDNRVVGWRLAFAHHAKELRDVVASADDAVELFRRNVAA